MTKAPLMPMATAVWLLDNTSLTFKQIAAFCKMHEVEIQGIADGEVGKGIVGYNPIIFSSMFLISFISITSQSIDCSFNLCSWSLIKSDLNNNDYLMVKASNATGFNRIIKNLRGSN